MHLSHYGLCFFREWGWGSALPPSLCASASSLRFRPLSVLTPPLRAYSPSLRFRLLSVLPIFGNSCSFPRILPEVFDSKGLQRHREAFFPRNRTLFSVQKKSYKKYCSKPVSFIPARKTSKKDLLSPKSRLQKTCDLTLFSLPKKSVSSRPGLQKTGMEQLEGSQEPNP